MFKKVLGKLTKVRGEWIKPVILPTAAEGLLRILRRNACFPKVIGHNRSPC